MDNLWMLFAAASVMVTIIGGLALLGDHYTLNNIKSKTVGDGQHGTARWATNAELRKTYALVPFQVPDWRAGKNLPEAQGLVLGSTSSKHGITALVDKDDVHCLMIGASGVGTSPSVDEQQLQQAILRAINSVMSDKPALVRHVTENLQVVIHPSRSGELTIAEIDHQLETLAQEFDAAFATAATGNAADYSERFKTILTQQTELKAKRAELEQQQAEDAELTSHMELAADTLEQAGTAITEWDEYQIRALVESVRILSNDEILVRLKSGIEKIERLQR